MRFLHVGVAVFAIALFAPHVSAAQTPVPRAAAANGARNRGSVGATQNDLLNLGLAFVNRTSPMAGLGGGVMMRTGPLMFDVGYRYKKIFAKDFVSTLLGSGESLKSQQVSFGVGVRF